jgi:hypothetical protein
MNAITKILIRLFLGLLVLTIIIVVILSRLSLKTLNRLIIILGVIVLAHYIKVKNDFGINSLDTEFLNKKQMGMNDMEYLKWLKMRYISLWSEALEKKQKGLIISQEYINQAELLEKEINNVKSRLGEPILQEKKFSEEFSKYKNTINK